MDAGAIERLSEAIRESNTERPSIATPAIQRVPHQTPEPNTAIEPYTDRADPEADRDNHGERGGVGADDSPHSAPNPTHQAPGNPKTPFPDERDQEREPAMERESKAAQIMRESQEQMDRDHDRDRDLGYGIE